MGNGRLGHRVSAADVPAAGGAGGPDGHAQRPGPQRALARRQAAIEPILRLLGWRRLVRVGLTIIMTSSQGRAPKACHF